MKYLLSTDNGSLEELIDAVDQVLDDMGKDGKSCCGYAKAKLRIAYEPFREDRELIDEYIMPLDVAKKLVYDADRGV